MNICDSKSACCIICGIPGSGKSFFSAKFSEFLFSNGIANVVISFDDIDNPETRDEKSFHETRERNLERVTTAMRTQIVQSSDNDSINQPNKNSELSFVLLVDDIMFYKSMRKEVWKISQKYEFAFVTVSLDLPLEEAFRRNDSRIGHLRLDDEVVKRIHRSFEPPVRVEDQTSKDFERFNVTIASHSVSSIEDSFLDTLHLLKESLRFQSEQSLLRRHKESLLSSEETSDHPPPQPHFPQENSVHKMDLFLREVVSRLLSCSGDVGSTNDVSTQARLPPDAAKRLSKAKSKALKAYRAQTVASNPIYADANRAAEMVSKESSKAYETLVTHDDMWLELFVDAIDDTKLANSVRSHLHVKENNHV